MELVLRRALRGASLSAGLARPASAAPRIASRVRPPPPRWQPRAARAALRWPPLRPFASGAGAAAGGDEAKKPAAGAEGGATKPAGDGEAAAAAAAGGGGAGQGGGGGGGGGGGAGATSEGGEEKDKAKEGEDKEKEKKEGEEKEKDKEKEKKEGKEGEEKDKEGEEGEEAKEGEAPRGRWRPSSLMDVNPRTWAKLGLAGSLGLIAYGLYLRSEEPPDISDIQGMVREYDPVHGPYLPPLEPGDEHLRTLVISVDRVALKSYWSRDRGWRFRVRPGFEWLLKRLSQGGWEVVLWCDLSDQRGQPLMWELDPNHRASHYLFRNSLRYLNKNVAFLGRDLRRVVFVDYKKPLETADNWMPVLKWDGSLDDRSFVKLSIILEMISRYNPADVRPLLTRFRERDDVSLQDLFGARLVNDVAREADLQPELDPRKYYMFENAATHPAPEPRPSLSPQPQLPPQRQPFSVFGPRAPLTLADATPSSLPSATAPLPRLPQLPPLPTAAAPYERRG
jgi:hypothetical protein